MVIQHRRPRPCFVGQACKPGHPHPHVAFLSTRRKVGFVPQHPDDVAGKMPLNLKNGIVVTGGNPDDLFELLAWDSSERLKLLETFPEHTSEKPGLLRLARPPR
jgi:hypothetical protein